MTINKARDFQRRQFTQPATGTDATIGQADVADEVDLFDEVEYRRNLVGRALQLMQAEFRKSTWRACWKSFMEGQSTAEISRESIARRQRPDRMPMVTPQNDRIHRKRFAKQPMPNHAGCHALACVGM